MRTDSLFNIIAQNKRDTNELLTINRLAYELSRSDLVKQRQLLHQGILLSKELNSWHISNFYALLATSHQVSTRLDSAQYYLDRIEELVKKDPRDLNSVENFNQTAGLFYKNTGRPRLALPYLKKTLEMTKDSANRGGQLLNIGNTYQALGELHTSAKYYMNSLAVFERIKNKRGLSFVYQGLGNTYLKMKQWSKAMSYFEKSLALKKELKDTRGVISATAAIGNIYLERKDYEKAINAFEQCLKTSTEMSADLEIAHALVDLAEAYDLMEDFPKAKEYYTKAIVIAERTGDSVWVADIRSNWMKLELGERDIENLEYGLLTTLRQYDEQGDFLGRSSAHNNLAQYYSQQHDYQKAFDHLAKSVSLTDSARGSGVDEQLRKLEEQYINEKRDREMELFKKDQDLKTADMKNAQEIQFAVIVVLVLGLIIVLLLVNRYQVISRNKRRIEIEMMRNAIARDLHDDIGSTLSSINILSQLAIKDGGQSGWRHFNKIAEQSGRMMESMSDIVWSISPDNDSLEQVVSKMKEFAAEILEPKNITFRFNGEDSLRQTTLTLEKRKNLFLIFKEAVNNAAKYSGATDLEITFMRTGNTLSLSVSDNGGGFEPQHVKTGNGLKNMKERARVLSARFDFVTRVSKGTRVALEIPIT